VHGIGGVPQSFVGRFFLCGQQRSGYGYNGAQLYNTHVVPPFELLQAAALAMREVSGARRTTADDSLSMLAVRVRETL
jgi:hypothetical protein